MGKRPVKMHSSKWMQYTYAREHVAKFVFKDIRYIHNLYTVKQCTNITMT